MIRRGHHDDRAEAVLGAPVVKHSPLVLGSGDCSRDLLDSLDAKGPEQPDIPSGHVLVRHAPADELPVHGVGRVREQGHPRGNPAVNQVCRFEQPGVGGINRHDDDICRLEGFVDDECPSSGPQDRCSNSRHGDRGASQQDHTQDESPSWPQPHPAKYYTGGRRRSCRLDHVNVGIA